jgi:hypothetical protein
MSSLELSPFITPLGPCIGEPTFTSLGKILSPKAPWAQFPSWKASSDVEITVELNVDLREILEQCNLAKDTELTISLTAKSKAARYSETVTAKLVDENNLLTFELSQFKFANQLEIAVTISTHEVNPKQQLDAFSPGSFCLLWQRKSAMDLEGNSGRIEIFAFDFAKTLHPKAMWRIEVDFPETAEDWQIEEVNSCLRILYNMERAAEIHLPSTRNLLRAEYIETIVDAAINRPDVLDFLLSSEFDVTGAGSLSQTARAYILALFSLGENRDNKGTEIANKWRLEKTEYLAAIQQLAGLS